MRYGLVLLDMQQRFDNYGIKRTIKNVFKRKREGLDMGRQNEVRDLEGSLEVQALSTNYVCNKPLILIGRNDNDTKAPAQVIMNGTNPPPTPATPPTKTDTSLTAGIC